MTAVYRVLADSQSKSVGLMTWSDGQQLFDALLHLSDESGELAHHHKRCNDDDDDDYYYY